jgi:putative transposase
VRFLGLYYRSDAVANLRRSVGQADIRMRADLENLGTIWVSRNVPGAEWFAVSSELDMEGVSAALWTETAAALRRKHAFASKLREHIVVAALHDLRESGRQSAAVAGIGPSSMSSVRLLKLEKEMFEHFDYTVAHERGRTFEGLEDNEPEAQQNVSGPASDNLAGQEAEVTAESDGADEPQHSVRRRRGRLKADFLRKD